MLSLRVSLVFLLATLAATLAQPAVKPTAAPAAKTAAAPAAKAQVPAVTQAYNMTESYTFTSEQIPTDEYMTDLVHIKREDGDERVVFTRITKNDVFPTRHSVTTTYFQFHKKTRITAIEVKNAKTKSGGFASIVAGGLGKDFVTFNFLSEPNNVLDYEVKIYCK